MTWDADLTIDGEIFTEAEFLAADASRVCELTGRHWTTIDPLASPDHLVGILSCFAARLHKTKIDVELVRFSLMPWTDVLAHALPRDAPAPTEQSEVTT